MRQGIYYSSPSTNVLHKNVFFYISLANVCNTANTCKFVYIKQEASKETCIFCAEILAAIPLQKYI